MDIIDIILARAKSFTGETKKLIQQAQKAMSDANEIVDNVSAVQQATEEANEAAQAAAQQATEAAETINALQDDIDTAISNQVEEAIGNQLDDVNQSISSLEERVENIEQNGGGSGSGSGTSTAVSISDANTSAAKIRKIDINGAKYDVEKNYTSYGDNEDGSMTQKAIKAYVTDVKSTLEQQIENHTGGTINLGPEYYGHLVVVDENGNIIGSVITEDDIINGIIHSDDYEARGALGMEIDYLNKSVIRTQEAITLSDPSEFSNYAMYGKRVRCNVDDNGRILAFYGDVNYKDDGSNGQVMIYQPKFYYQRLPLITEPLQVGKAILKESILVSTEPQLGFKVHPIFLTPDGEELDYVLFSAYEAGLFDASANDYDILASATIDEDNDKLTSVAGVKPVTKMTIAQAEQLARNRGQGWHIENMAAVSANQMLAIVEMGSLNGQKSLEEGICAITSSFTINYASQTGSTAALGNATGAAISTLNITNGQTNDYNIPTKRAISYRGMENPWGNIWKMIAGVNLYGNGNNAGGAPYICNNFNYNPSALTENYENIGFNLPVGDNWIAALGYGDEKYDWVFLPAKSGGTANSAAPVGDTGWYSTNFNGINCLLVGGNGAHGDRVGLFNYACDHTASNSSVYSYGARLMFIPMKNEIYNENYNAWKQL